MVSGWNNGLALAGAVAIVVLAMTSTGVMPAAARTTVDLRAGGYTDANAMGIGGGVMTDVGRGGAWMFNPNLEIVFPDGGNLFTMNGDFHYEFPSSSSLGTYAGAGPALLIADPNVGGSRTDFGLDLIGGVTGRRGTTHPFGQAKIVLSDNTEFALMGGVRF